MSTKRLILLPAFFLMFALQLLAATAASASQTWDINTLSSSTVAPGATFRYLVEVRNIGDAPFEGENTTLIELPAGMTALEASIATYPAYDFIGMPCAVEGPNLVKCTDTESLSPRQGFHLIRLTVEVDAGVSPDTILTPHFTASGGGAPLTAQTDDPVLVSASPPGFGIDAADTQQLETDGSASTQAGGHPASTSVTIDFNTVTDPAPLKGIAFPVEPIKTVVTELAPGFTGSPATVGTCTAAQLANTTGFEPKSLCPTSSQIGTSIVRTNNDKGLNGTSIVGPTPVYNMVPPPGIPARFGFNISGTVTVLDASLRSDGDYGVTVTASNISEAFSVAGTTVTFWGQPSSPSHDLERACPGESQPYFGNNGPVCDSGAPATAFLRNPTSCTEPEETPPTTVSTASWVDPGDFDSTTLFNHESPAYPLTPDKWGPKVGIDGCAIVPLKGKLSAQPTSIDTTTSSGLAVHVEVPNLGYANPDGIASSDIRSVRVAFPEGMTVNPSQAEGLGACSPAQYASTRLEFHPDGLHGCPSDSKLGSVEVQTPVISETIPGDVYIAQPYDNPFGSLLALYVVLHNEQRGILVKLAGKVETDERTGQISASFDDLPQLPFSTFDFRFREGARAPLVTPAACGSYETVAEFTGHSDPDGPPLISKSSFEITRGIGGGPCPSGGLPPFKPGLIAGTVNNRAGSYSPFNLRLFRSDEEQEITHFSIKLPPGVIGKLAGVGTCSDATLEAAKAKMGAAELASPSCPASSLIGNSLAGAGVGSVQTYAPGRIYLAGPYNGAQHSIVAITAAKVGPFDLGTVIVRQALRIDPRTAEVFIDPTGSDPLPHIIKGITTHLRDIRAYVDRPEFVANPTSCRETSTASTLLGSGLDFSSAVDDLPVTVSTRFQAADCGALAFKPKLRLFTLGAHRRAGNPRFKAVLTMKPGEANIARAQVTLPKSEFLDNSHIRTICTRVQYAADNCPPGSIYGKSRAFTPLLDTPLEGPVYLRSSEHELPDLVAKLANRDVQIDLVGRVDSIGHGQIRNTFEAVPDAPVSRFVLEMQGGKKGLLENSANLCKGKHRAISAFDGQNGKVHDTRPLVRHDCGKGGGKGKKDGRGNRGAGR